MKRCQTDTCSLTLPLKVEKWQADRLDKRFELGRQLYNTLLKQKMKAYERLKHAKEFRETAESLDALFENHQKDGQEYRNLSKKRGELLKSAGFSEFAFISAIRPLYKCYRENIDSNMAPVIAQDVWKSFQKFLFGNGREVHFKKVGEVNALSGQRSRSSIRFFGDHVWYNGLILPVRRDPDNAYEQEMLTRRIKFCRVLRKLVKGRYQYAVQLILEGIPALKRDKETGKAKAPLGSGRVGLHVGVQFLTYVSEKGPGTAKLVGDSELQKEKRLLQRKMNRSLLSQNSESSFQNGRFKAKKGKLKKSNRYVKLQARYQELCRKNTQTRILWQNRLVNRTLMLGNEFYSDQTDYSLLSRRCKKPKDQKINFFGKGAFIGENAPASFLRQLDRKVKYRSGQGIKMVSLKTVNLTDDTPEFRMDLYIAFLLQRYGEEFLSLDTRFLLGEYQNFITA